MAKYESLIYFASKVIILWAVTYKNVICFNDDGDPNSSDHSQCKDVCNSTKLKTILFFAIPRSKGSPYLFLDETKKMCPQCIFTENQDTWEISDAVVFYGNALNKRPPVHLRPRVQIWVYLNFESDSSRSYFKKVSKYIDVFNWTMTYRHDSDVVVPYGRFVSMDEVPTPNYDETWAFSPTVLSVKNTFMSVPSFQDIKNRRMAAWIVSECGRPSGRDLFVKELQKYIQVDIYGKCGNFTCEAPRSEFRKGNCRYQISKQYKFYLAFENSLCEDYVTEKYFDTLHTQMIPVVYGDANYSNLAPKKSYINVSDFKSIEELANHLKYLDSNPNEFLKYFEWRKHYWVQNNRYVTGYCDLCKKLWNYDQSTSKYYHNITEWWLRRSDFESSGLKACREPDTTNIYKVVQN